MTERHIVAMGGGGIGGSDPLLDEYVLSLCSRERPRVAFLGTASGDDPYYQNQFLRAFLARGCEPSTIRLFERDITNLREFVLSQDVVLVGGGSTANMLAVWRVHGLDVILRDAWQAGIVLAGTSAGANCWFEASTTDSFLIGNADPLADGLGLVPGSFCPHFSSEPARAPRFSELVRSGELPAGYACDDGAALHFEGSDLKTAVVARSDAAAYRVTRSGDDVSVTPLAATVLASGRP